MVLWVLLVILLDYVAAGTCPVGYHFNDGDIPGVSDAYFSITLQACADTCSGDVGCMSFEYSPSEERCHVNLSPTPTAGRYSDYDFCVKDYEDCATDGRVYTPIFARGVSHTATADICRERCRSVPGCAFFQWWDDFRCTISFSDGAKVELSTSAIAGHITCGASCNDGMLNQDEERVDCGGVCAPCGSRDLLTDYIHHWDFEEGAGASVADKGYGSLPGTIIDGAWGVRSNGDGYLSFDGVDDAVALGPSTFGGTLTIAAMARFRSQSAQHVRLIEFATETDSDDAIVMGRKGNEVLYAYYHENGYYNAESIAAEGCCNFGNRLFNAPAGGYNDCLNICIADSCECFSWGWMYGAGTHCTTYDNCPFPGSGDYNTNGCGSSGTNGVQCHRKTPKRTIVGGTIVFGEWIHLAVALSESEVIVYANGVEVARKDPTSNAYPGPVPRLARTFNWIGKRNRGDYSLDGDIADLRMYSYNLVDSEIEDLYHDAVRDRGCAVCDTECIECTGLALVPKPGSCTCECAPGYVDYNPDGYAPWCKVSLELEDVTYFVYNETASLKVSVSSPLLSGELNASLVLSGIGTYMATFRQNVSNMTLPLGIIPNVASTQIRATLSGETSPGLVAFPPVVIPVGSRPVVSIVVNELPNLGNLVLFSEPMDQASVLSSLELKVAGGPALDFTTEWVVPGRSLYLFGIGQLNSLSYMINVNDTAVSTVGIPVVPYSTLYSTLSFVYYVLPRVGSAVFAETLFAMVVFKDPFMSDTPDYFSVTNEATGEAIPGTFETEGAIVLTFTPSVPLPDSTRFRATVGGSTRNVFNVSLGEDFVWTFSTRVVIPEVVTVFPPDQALDIPRDGTVLRVEFSKAMDTVATEAALMVFSGEQRIVGSVVWKENTLMYTLPPLLSDALYYVFISGALDVHGNALSPFDWSFRSADTIAPAVLSMTPNATAVDIGGLEVVIQFSEAMSADGTLISVVSSGGVLVRGSSTWNSAHDVVSYSLISPPDDAELVATLELASDPSGNVIASPVSVSFSTNPACTPACAANARCLAHDYCRCNDGFGPSAGPISCSTALVVTAVDPPIFPYRSSASVPFVVSVSGSLLDPVDSINLLCEFILPAPHAVLLANASVQDNKATCDLPVVSPAVVADFPRGVSVAVSLRSAEIVFAPLSCFLTACPNGHIVGDNASCVPCPAGLFADASLEPNQTNCLPCPPGRGSRAPGSTECIVCASPTCEEPSTLGAVVVVNAEESSSGTGVLVASILLTCFLMMLLLVAVVLFATRMQKKKTMRDLYVDEDATVRASQQDNQMSTLVQDMLQQKSAILLGTGLYANVYKCKKDKEDVVVKVVKASEANRLDARREFQREIAALSALTLLEHPAIVKLCFVVHARPMAIVCEYVQGGTLMVYVDQNEVPMDTKLRLMVELASGLAAIHSARIAHLDMKTENVMVDPDAHVRIIDFGISRMFESQDENSRFESMSTLSTRQSLSGVASIDTAIEGFSPRYVDPSRLLCEYDAELMLYRADVYSFGAVVWATVAEQEPFHELSLEELQSALRTQPDMHPPLDNVPEVWRTVLSSCWLPVDRRPSMQEVHDMLVDNGEDILDGEHSLDSFAQTQ